MGNIDKDTTTAKEKVSGDKIKSVWGIIAGFRAHQFDALLKKAPTSGQLSSIALELEKPEIGNVIFDLDGTLVSPYAAIPEEVVENLRGYSKEGRQVAIYTNSPHSARLDVLSKAGIDIAQTGRGKPSLEGFRILCDQCDMDPLHTAMVGNSPITDMPLVENGEAPLFPMNVLVESIPPQRKLVESWSKYFRARVFHAICVAAAGVVKLRNHHMIREVD